MQRHLRPARAAILGVQTLTDPEIVRRARDGDVEAFSVLVERHRRRVYNTCLKLVRDPDAAQECSQKTFILAHQRLAQFRAEAQFSTWLTTIAMRVALTWLRQSGWSPETPIEELPLGDQELRRLLRRALDALAPPYRAVLLLRDIEERSTRETARILGISEPAVKTRLLRARIRMRVTVAHALLRAASALVPARVEKAA